MMFASRLSIVFVYPIRYKLWKTIVSIETKRFVVKIAKKRWQKLPVGVLHIVNLGANK